LSILLRKSSFLDFIILRCVHTWDFLIT
jgi:hypothetical protein